jgi:hypothetical protein
VETTFLASPGQTFKGLWPNKAALAKYLQPDDIRTPQWLRRMLLICLVVFLLAVGVRLLHWQDNRPIFPKLFTGMVENYKSNARLLLKGDVRTFVTGPSPPGDANILTYPPGYPIIMGVVFNVFGESDTPMRWFQIICDAVAAVLLVLIAAELLPLKIAAIAGVLSALSPQLAYYSLILLPDSLATLPILLATYFIIRAKKSNSFGAVVAAGALIGVSCWLRSNALLMAPFLAIPLFFIMERARRGRYAAALVGAALLVIAPITIRNVVVFHRFIPLSLGMGQMLNVGISDYDKERRFGLPGTDIETVTSEAEAYNRPDYAESLFGGNGIEREQRRTSRALTVVRSHPLWFGGVVLRRATSMLRLERVHRIETAPGVTSRLAVAQETQPVWSRNATDLAVEPAGPGATKSYLTSSGQTVIHENDFPGVSHLITSIPVEKNTDYLLKVPVVVERGNVIISVTRPFETSRYGSTPILSPLERIKPSDESLDVHQIAFVSPDADQVSLRLENAGTRGGKTVVKLGRLELFRLGPASFLWTRYIRIVIHNAQRFFLTAWILPLALMGVGLLLLAGRRDVVLILLAVPAYYLCFQSVLHTEYRYVLAVQPFLYLMAAVSLYFTGSVLWRAAEKLRTIH